MVLMKMAVIDLDLDLFGLNVVEFFSIQTFLNVLPTKFIVPFRLEVYFRIWKYMFKDAFEPGPKRSKFTLFLIFNIHI